MKNNLFIIALALPLLYSCTSARKASVVPVDVLQSNCAPTTPRNYIWNTPDLQPVLTEKDLARFSKKSWQMANLLQVRQVLIEIMKLEEKPKINFSIEDRIRWLELKQLVADKINLTSLEISATAAELDCEEERANQLKGVLQEKINRTEKRITVAAIVTGATTGLLVGILNLSNKNANLSEEIAIAGGLAEATFGFLSLGIKRHHIFNHPRNHLNDIWLGPDTTSNFPPIIWHYLNLPFDTAQLSLRESLKKQWISLEQLSLENNKKVALYFAEGGVYSDDDLNNRSSMLDQLEAIVSLMKKDLQLITKELVEGENNN